MFIPGYVGHAGVSTIFQNPYLTFRLLTEENYPLGYCGRYIHHAEVQDHFPLQIRAHAVAVCEWDENKLTFLLCFRINKHRISSQNVAVRSR